MAAIASVESSSNMTASSFRCYTVVVVGAAAHAFRCAWEGHTTFVMAPLVRLGAAVHLCRCACEGTMLVMALLERLGVAGTESADNKHNDITLEHH